MPAVFTDTKLYKALYVYKNHYLNNKRIKELEDSNESQTRVIINHLLSDVLGYAELDDIKTEYPVRGGFIDYLIELDDKKIFTIEAKTYGTKLTDKHLRQAIYYATTVGSDWIILTDGRMLELYRIKYSKPVIVRKLFSIDLMSVDVNSRQLVSYLTKASINKGELDKLIKVYDQALGFS